GTWPGSWAARRWWTSSWNIATPATWANAARGTAGVTGAEHARHARCARRGGNAGATAPRRDGGARCVALGRCLIPVVSDTHHGPSFDGPVAGLAMASVRPRAAGRNRQYSRADAHRITAARHIDVSIAARGPCQSINSA